MALWEPLGELPLLILKAIRSFRKGNTIRLTHKKDV